MTAANDQERVVVAGASGFVGRALRERFPETGWIGLSRSNRESDDNTEWRQCDVYSLDDTARALRGTQTAVYLVHSMQPSSALSDGTFADFDLLAADNFARGAAAAGIRHIIYLGGLVPPSGELSPHLQSRQEVEQALGATGIPVTVLRAGLVIGAGGSSFTILTRLSQRLPVMVTPRWTQTQNQPVGLDDVTSIIRWFIDHPEHAGQTWDLGCPQVLTYNDMMRRTGRAIGRQPWILSVPFFSLTLSRLWVSLFSGQPRELVDPLIESLREPMIARDRRVYELSGIPSDTFAEALAKAASANNTLSRTKVATQAVTERTVTSIQRLPLPDGWCARDVADAYGQWLSGAVAGLIHVEASIDRLRFTLRGTGAMLLELSKTGSGDDRDRVLFKISGGLLADNRNDDAGYFEFRTTTAGGQVLASIQDFRPRLPWVIYKATQYRVHAWVMRRFGTWLRFNSGSPAGAVVASVS